MKRSNNLSAWLAALSALVFCTAVLAQSRAADEPRVAIKGYDTVAYFTQGKPVMGTPQFAYDWDDARYYFANTKHRELFMGNPERYAPRFGGYCTGSMSRGKKTAGNPELWVIVDERLYLVNGLTSAERLRNDPAPVISAAQKHWDQFRK
jgi:YHS domain-containing protein